MAPEDAVAPIAFLEQRFDSTLEFRDRCGFHVETYGHVRFPWTTRSRRQRFKALWLISHNTMRNVINCVGPLVSPDESKELTVLRFRGN
jgi:hypothetical protein